MFPTCQNFLNCLTLEQLKWLKKAFVYSVIVPQRFFFINRYIYQTRINMKKYATY